MLTPHILRLDKKCGLSAIPDHRRCTKRTTAASSSSSPTQAATTSGSLVPVLSANRTRLLLTVAGGATTTAVLGVLANDVFTKGLKPTKIPPPKPPEGLYDSFKPGDLIYNGIDFLGAKRAHYAVYVGKRNGVHTVFDISGAAGQSKAGLRAIDVAAGNGSSFAPAVRLNKDPNSVPTSDQLMRIISQLDGKSFSYDGYTRNCESFARAVVGDLPVSTQGREVTGMTRAITRKLISLAGGSKLTQAELKLSKIRNVVRRTRGDANALTPLALRLAGPSTAYYQSHPRARRHKVAHQAAINRRPAERRRRSALNSERRQRGIYSEGGPDVSHTTSGDTVLETPSTNRARNGAGGRPRLRRDADTVFLNRRLHAQVKAKAKRLFDVYPSAYANAWMVKEYKRLGGKFRSDALDTWFKERWVRMSSTGRILGPCGDRTEGEGKPKCLPLARAQALTPGACRTLVARKRHHDPDKNRSGAPIMVSSTTDAEGDGKKYTKTVVNPETGRTRRIRYGASGYRIAPGTTKGDRYCARSFGDMKSHGKDCSGPDRNTPLCLSRAKWRCSGKASRRDALHGLTPLTVLGVFRLFP